jgi:hypothetical protein
VNSILLTTHERLLLLRSAQRFAGGEWAFEARRLWSVAHHLGMYAGGEEGRGRRNELCLIICFEHVTIAGTMTSQIKRKFPVQRSVLFAIVYLYEHFCRFVGEVSGSRDVENGRVFKGIRQRKQQSIKTGVKCDYVNDLVGVCSGRMECSFGRFGKREAS